jgi:hypothetical protein
MVQLCFDSPGVYAILSTCPTYFSQPHRSSIHKKAMYPMATVSHKRSAFSSSKLFILRHDTQTTYVADNCGQLFGTRVCWEYPSKNRVSHVALFDMALRVETYRKAGVRFVRS